jgi:hypothetical protein
MTVRATGPRPSYFDDPQFDRLLAMVLALTEEVVVLRERLATHEHFLDRHDLVSQAEIESYAPDEADELERTRVRSETIERVLRSLLDETASLAERGPSNVTYEDVVREVSIGSAV